MSHPAMWAAPQCKEQQEPPVALAGLPGFPDVTDHIWGQVCWTPHLCKRPLFNFRKLFSWTTEYIWLWIHDFSIPSNIYTWQKYLILLFFQNRWIKILEFWIFCPDEQKDANCFQAFQKYWKSLPFSINAKVRRMLSTWQLIVLLHCQAVKLIIILKACTRHTHPLVRNILFQVIMV